MSTLIDLIDLGGKLDTEIKDKKKDLDRIKVKLRKEMGEKQLEESYGTEYILKASDYTSTEIDKESVIKSMIGMRTAQIDPESDVTLKGIDLIRLLTATNFTAKQLKKVFTEDGMNAITTKQTKQFYTLSFKKAD